MAKYSSGITGWGTAGFDLKGAGGSFTGAEYAKAYIWQVPAGGGGSREGL